MCNVVTVVGDIAIGLKYLKNVKQKEKIHNLEHVDLTDEIREADIVLVCIVLLLTDVQPMNIMHWIKIARAAYKKSVDDILDVCSFITKQDILFTEFKVTAVHYVISCSLNMDVLRIWLLLITVCMPLCWAFVVLRVLLMFLQI